MDNIYQIYLIRSTDELPKKMRKRADINGDRKYSDDKLSFCIHDYALAYMFLIAFDNLSFISW